jgi:hypothetical protein
VDIDQQVLVDKDHIYVVRWGHDRVQRHIRIFIVITDYFLLHLKPKEGKISIWHFDGFTSIL